MSRRKTAGYGKCACNRWITLRLDGTFYPHGPLAAPCLGVGCTPEQAARLVLPALTEAQLDMMRECWRIGDWRPIELEFGIEYPLLDPKASTHEEALAEMVGSTRRWIEGLIELSRSHEPQNFDVPNDTRTR